MFKKTLGCLAVVGALSIHPLFMPTAVADITVPETHCIYKGCDDPAPNNSTPSYTPSGPTQEELRQQREAKELNEAAQDADDKGVAAYQKGDYAGAVRYFSEAINYAPDDNDIKHNLQRAQQRLRDAEAARRAEEARQAELEQQRGAEDERRRHEEAERQADSLRGSTGMRITPNTPSGTALRGSSADTELRGLNSESNTSQLRGSNTEAGSQLKSVEKHGRTTEALQGEASSEQARRGFDTAGEKSGLLVYSDKHRGGKSTFGSSLSPEAKKDPQIQQSLAWHRKNESLKADTAKKIAAIKEQQKKGAGDEAVLSAQLGTLTNQMNQYTKDEAKAKQDIKVRVKDLGLSWDEK